jgi:hypothetical protein
MTFLGATSLETKHGSTTTIRRKNTLEYAMETFGITSQEKAQNITKSNNVMFIVL